MLTEPLDDDPHTKYQNKRKRVTYFRLTEQSYHSSLRQCLMTETPRDPNTTLPAIPVNIMQRHAMDHYRKLQYTCKKKLVGTHSTYNYCREQLIILASTKEQDVRQGGSR